MTENTPDMSPDAVELRELDRAKQRSREKYAEIADGIEAVFKERDALRARVKALEEALRWVHNNPTAHPENRKRVVKGALDTRHDQPDQGGGQ